jgi:selenide,water dikinase
VFRVRPDLAIVQTVDFFPPIVDDPLWFGRIAAANSLSDIYAMGARPITGLNIVGFPAGEMPMEVLGAILKGGAEKMIEAGAALIGGHSVVDQEIKYGLAVTGVIHPDHIARNGGAQVGDRLVLTKPIGMGTMATALKKERLTPAQIDGISRQMAELNKNACEAMVEVGINGCTDVTGFGLLGHTVEMADGSKTTIVLEAHEIPVYPGATELAHEGLCSGRCGRAKKYLTGKVAIASGPRPRPREPLLRRRDLGAVCSSPSPPRVTSSSPRPAGARRARGGDHRPRRAGERRAPAPRPLDSSPAAAGVGGGLGRRSHDRSHDPITRCTSLPPLANAKRTSAACVAGRRGQLREIS